MIIIKIYNKLSIFIMLVTLERELGVEEAKKQVVKS